MKNERGIIHNGKGSEIARRKRIGPPNITDQEIISDRFTALIEEIPCSSAPRNRWGQSVGERHTSGFRTWLQEDLEHYTGRPR